MKVADNLFWKAGAIALATSLVVGGLGLVRLPEARSRVGLLDSKPARVGIAELSEQANGGLAQSELILQDPTPLFLPTEYNSGRVVAAMTAERSPGPSFGSIPAKMLFGDSDIGLDLPEAVAIPDRALELVVKSEPQVDLTELARRTNDIGRLPEREGYLQVLSMSTGAALWSQQVTVGSWEFDLEAPWEFILAVNQMGSISFPAVVDAGEGALIDITQITDVLRKKHLGARLEPGIYRILLGP